MQEFVIKKEFVRLLEEGSYQDRFNPEDTFFLPEGTEGVILDEGTINLIPNLSEERYSEIVSWFLRSLKRTTYLVLMAARIVELPMEMFEHVRYEPPGPFFEDEADLGDWIDELNLEMKHAYEKLNKGEKDAST